MRGYYVGNQATYFLNGKVLRWVLKTDPKYLNKCSQYASELQPRFKKSI